MDIDEFIRRNGDPIWLHQNEMWEHMDQAEDPQQLCTFGCLASPNHRAQVVCDRETTD
jgi:hypothetical protein